MSGKKAHRLDIEVEKLSEKESRRTSPQHVLVLNQFAVPATYPGGTRHVEMFSLLKSWDASFVIGDLNYFSGEKVSTSDSRFTVLRLRINGKSPVRRALGWAEYAVKAIGAGLRERGVDVVYASSPHLLSPVAGWVLAKMHRAKLVVEIRDLWPESFVALRAIRANGKLHVALQLLERWIYRRADWIVGVSSQWSSYFHENAPSKPFTAIPNGTDVIAFASAERPEFGSLSELCKKTVGLNFVFAGSHGPKDGLDLLLDAAPEFPEDLFVLIGDGSDKVNIAERIHREQMKNVVMLDPVTKATLPGYLKLMDVGLHLVSDWDVFKMGMSPNKLHDYLAAGLPVISNAPGEPHEILEDSMAGIGVAPRDISTGIREMKAYTNEERVRMGTSGHGWMVKYRSRQIVAEVLESVLNEVSNTPR